MLIPDNLPPLLMAIHYHDWPIYSIQSIRKWLPNNQIILINHLPNQQLIPQQYLIGNCTIINNHNPNPPASPATIPQGVTKSHGEAIDIGVKYFKTVGSPIFIHIEPDCIVYGRQWYDDIILQLQTGYHMAGPYQLPHGPIHPCVSGWRTSAIPDTFMSTPRNQAVDETLFNYTRMVQELAKCLQNKPNTAATRSMAWFLCHHWDCGIHNWYQLALHNQTKLTTKQGIKHYFNGTTKKPRQLDQQEQQWIHNITGIPIPTTNDA